MSTTVPESSRQGTEAGDGLGDPTQLDEVPHSSFSLCCRDGSKLWTSSWQHLPTGFRHQPYATSPRFSYHISSASGDLASSTKSVHSKHGTRSTSVCSGNPWFCRFMSAYSMWWNEALCKATGDAREGRRVPHGTRAVFWFPQERLTEGTKPHWTLVGSLSLAGLRKRQRCKHDSRYYNQYKPCLLRT